jgi:hypothetical protein
VLVITDHTSVDYRQVARHAHLVVDTRGVMRQASGGARVVGLSGVEEALEERRLPVKLSAWPRSSAHAMPVAWLFLSLMSRGLAVAILFRFKYVRYLHLTRSVAG